MVTWVKLTAKAEFSSVQTNTRNRRYTKKLEPGVEKVCSCDAPG